MRGRLKYSRKWVSTIFLPSLTARFAWFFSKNSCEWSGASALPDVSYPKSYLKNVNTGKIENRYRYVLRVWVLNKRCFKITIIINAFIIFYAIVILRIESDVSEVFSHPSPHKWSVTHADDVRTTDPSDDALGTSNRVASSRFQFSRHCASPDWRKLNKQK